jgi:ATP phosphoribosyltransferase regulatory subunit
MVYQPAAGARDLLPLDVAQKRWIEDRLQQVFHRWGYHRIITSTLERMDTLMAGGAIGRRTVLKLQNQEQEELGLRPELTASIARTAVTRMLGTEYPQRLYYNANVFQRRESKHNRQQEFYQAGVELLGSGGLLANAEILLLVADCVAGLSLNNWHLVLGEAGITRSLLEAFPPKLLLDVRNAIANLDRVALDELPLSDELHERARLMLDLRGRPEVVFEKLANLVSEPSQQEAVDGLKSLVELLELSGDFSIILDLSLIQTFDYYTGVVFEVVTNTNSQSISIGRGGRYDNLLGLYHPQSEDVPGIGFVFLLDALYDILAASQQLPQTTPAANWLVVASEPEAYTTAFAYSSKLRSSAHLVRVEMDLGGRDAEAIREYATHRGIGQIAWIKADSPPVIESV